VPRGSLALPDGITLCQLQNLAFSKFHSPFP
jgi:hypothetical protein